MLENINFVLLGTTHPGNIGAAARAMKTMGLSQLSLVQPAQFPCAEATARASGADDVLTAARVTDSLDEAIARDSLILGTSARVRNLPVPLLNARQAASKIMEELASGGRVAVLFGKERYGLTNEEMERCHALVNLPTVENFSSLNLAAAVQVLAYECRMAELEYSSQDPLAEYRQHRQLEPVPHEKMASFYAHLFAVLEQAGVFDNIPSETLKRRLKLMFNRMQPQKHELDILRGIFSNLQKKMPK
jgi:tRNA (cytidine32/uridine32-2'-O)-methyltransferase